MQDDAEVALAWLNQILAQMLDDAPWTLVPADPFASILEINKLRERLEGAGLEVPAIVDPNMRNTTTMDRLEFYERSLNRLARTFSTQIEALKKYRAGPQQVVVEHRHYHLHQEAPGDETQPGVGVFEEKEHQPHVRNQGRFPERETVRGSLEANGAAMPGPGHEGKEGVPLPWREGDGRALGHS
ncbi:MAG: hypothetical protein IPK28_15040 [Devosia sp.]|nr:hypothetical protein [Devosia sp.]